ncbi:hypothetical protein F1188_01695 [Roseospira marina]|uniref:Uncharacterized protein n=1 Tax=Roseospira marina TaxID=140057 RepID=A0A5M6IGU5_9PROT|nr:hypothetical protein [Roseospira marina]KAA5607503.1 hypothetical protein F1188_01695 [Roseospira marina]MBB4312313.1 hypothetical protein [Roseospira marina]MBB5085671.1 hypothetical protein [Roseospira marina]
MAKMKLGAVVPFDGNVTCLVRVRPGDEDEMEEKLGFREGHLAGGYFVLLMRQFFTCDDFRLAGYTYFTGRRMGRALPAGPNDTLRTHMYDQVMKAHGLDGVHAFQDLARKGQIVTGRKRIAKIVPAVKEDAGGDRKDLHPPGRGVPQFELARKRAFLVALEVKADGTAVGSDFRADLRIGGQGARAQVRQYLEGA